MATALGSPQELNVKLLEMDAEGRLGSTVLSDHAIDAAATVVECGVAAADCWLLYISSASNSRAQHRTMIHT